LAPNFNGGRPQILDEMYKITPISDLLSYKVAYRSSDLEDSAAIEKKERRKLLLKNRIPPFTIRVGRGIINLLH